MTYFKESMPQAAIITPVYNGAAYLEAAMKSVQAQNYPNLIHITLDNASTDKTSEIIAKFQGLKVPVYYSRNKELLSLQHNWNTAIKLIPKSTQYVYFLSADDVIAENFINRTVDVFERHPNVGVVCTLYHINDNPTVDTGWPSDCEFFSGLEATGLALKNITRLPGNTAVYRREELERYQPFFNPDLFLCDLNATMRTLQSSDLGFVHSDLLSYCYRENSISTAELDKAMRWDYEWMYLMYHYGPTSMSKPEFEQIFSIYQRVYFSKLLKWKLGVNRKNYKIHMSALQNLGLQIPTLKELVDSVAQRGFNRLKRVFR